MLYQVQKQAYDLIEFSHRPEEKPRVTAYIDNIYILRWTSIEPGEQHVFQTLSEVANCWQNSAKVTAEAERPFSSSQLHLAACSFRSGQPHAAVPRLKGRCDKVQGCVLAVSDQQHSSGQGQLSSSTVPSKLIKGAWSEYKLAMAGLAASLTSSPIRDHHKMQVIDAHTLIDGSNLYTWGDLWACTQKAGKGMQALSHFMSSQRLCNPIDALSSSAFSTYHGSESIQCL